MTWESRYLPPNHTIWLGHADAPMNACFHQHIQLINLLKQKIKKSSENAFALIGFKCDEGTQRDLGRSGSMEGPLAIRHRLAHLPIQKPTLCCYDVGDIICNDHDLEESQQALSEIVSILLKENIVTIVIGGGHELAFGHYQGIATCYPPEKKLGIINFDAHFDLHSLHPHHRAGATTAFYQIAEAHFTEKRHFDYNCIGIQHAGNIRQLFDIAKHYHVKYILADDIHQGLREKSFDFIDRIIDENDIIYLSLSLDVFSAAHAPGVNSIQPLGLNPWDVIPLIRQAASSGKVVGYDIVEHVPRYDIDHRTAKLAAILIYEIIHHHNDQKMIFA
ncbi:MAG: formimidoylglutamase [Gammaproteobacteria bacterium RIFCSPHIGHO2_12_FULL_37_34]|nr:MAG: formimidoylglutamase [Gammaproteobacteria bacterium RIFCSPHIGHO2_12_FULL_37_34]